MILSKMRRTPKQILQNAGMAIVSLLVIGIYGSLVAVIIYWLVGIHLGFDVFKDELTYTQLAQVLVGSLFLDGVSLLLVRHFWLQKKTAKFWHYVRACALIIASLVFITMVIVPSILLSRGRQGGDYGCKQAITLRQAFRSSFPIYTDVSNGTAFAIDNHGTLITAYHVIEGAKTIAVGVYHPGTKLEVLKVNKDYDVALLKYPHPTPDFLPLTSTYRIGDPVYEIGWPVSSDDAGGATLTRGVVSRTVTSQNAKDSGDEVPDGLSFIQTDAATSPGNSGGPLVNACGALGVVNSSYTTDTQADSALQSGINYVTSSESVRAALLAR